MAHGRLSATSEGGVIRLAGSDDDVLFTIDTVSHGRVCSAGRQLDPGHDCAGGLDGFFVHDDVAKDRRARDVAVPHAVVHVQTRAQRSPIQKAMDCLPNDASFQA